MEQPETSEGDSHEYELSAFLSRTGKLNAMQKQGLVDKLVKDSRNLGIKTHMLNLAESYLQRSREELRSVQKWSKSAPSHEALGLLQKERAEIKRRIKSEAADVRILSKNVSRLEAEVRVSKRKLVGRR